MSGDSRQEHDSDCRSLMPHSDDRDCTCDPIARAFQDGLAKGYKDGYAEALRKQHITDPVTP